MFKFLRCVLRGPAEEVFTTPGHLSLSTVDFFIAFLVLFIQALQTFECSDLMFLNSYQLKKKAIARHI